MRALRSTSRGSCEQRGSRHFREAVAELAFDEVLRRVDAARQLSIGDIVSALPAIARGPDPEGCAASPRLWCLIAIAARAL